MADLAVTRRIDAAPQAVWKVVSDLEHAPQHVSGIKRIEIITPERPIGAGTRFRETRVMLGREATEEMTIAAWSPPRGYVLECRSCGCQYRSELSLVPDGSGTNVSMTFDARPISFMAKLMAPLGKLMMGPMRKCLVNDLDDLAASIVGGADPSARAQQA